MIGMMNEPDFKIFILDVSNCQPTDNFHWSTLRKIFANFREQSSWNGIAGGDSFR